MNVMIKKTVALLLAALTIIGASNYTASAIIEMIPAPITEQQTIINRNSQVYECPATEVPEGAMILERFWKYTYTTTVDSENPDLEGYTCTGSDWVEKESGTTNWANFPEGFDKSHNIYKTFSQSQPYSEDESETTKIVVSNSKAGYVYWHWMYSVSSYSDNMKRAIYNKKGTGPYTGFVYKTMQAQVSSIDHPRASDGYVEMTGIPSYDVSSEFHTFATIGHTSRCFRFEFYACHYIKYIKMYHYTKTEHLSSDTAEITGDGVITDIVEWVRYRLSEYDGAGLSDWTEASLAPENARIEAEKWVYEEKQTCESTEPSLEGWTQIESSWEQTGTGSVYYVPGGIYYGFDSTSENYALLNHEPYEESESITKKRTVENEKYGYCYWHWTQHKGSNDTIWYNRYLSDVKTSSYKYFASILSTEEWTILNISDPCPAGNKYYRYKGYSTSSSFSSAQKPPEIGNLTDCFNFLGFEYYISKYTDYQCHFTYEKYQRKESYTEVVPNDNIINIVKYVKYVLDLEKDGDFYYDPYNIVYKLTESGEDDVPGTAMVCGLRKSTSSLNIPSIVYYDQKAYRVVRIEPNSFKNQTSIKRITVSNNIVFIGESAFEGCIGLKSVVIPETVKTMGKAVFKNCTQLISVSMGHGVRTISESSFYGCSALEKVSVGREVTEIETLAFAECENLLSVQFSGARPLISANAFQGIAQNSKRGFYYGTDNETEWKGYCGWNKDYVNDHNNGYLLPGNENYAEWRIYGQRTISYLDDNGVDYQGNKYICDILSNTAMLLAHDDDDSVDLDGNITIPSSVCWQGNEYQVTAIGESAFCDCISIRSIIIGPSVKNIERSAFSGCASLQNITIEGTLTSIQDNAFFGCISISRIYFFEDAPVVVSETALPSDLVAYVICSEVASGFGTTWCDIPIYNYRTTDNIIDYEKGLDYEKDNNNINYKIIDETEKLVIVGDRISTTGENDNGRNIATGYTGGGEITVADFIRSSDSSVVYMVVGLDRYAFHNNNSVTTINLGEFIGYNNYPNAIWDYSFGTTNALTAINVNSKNKSYASIDGVLYKLKETGGVIHKSLLMRYPSAKSGTDFAIPEDMNIEAYAFANQKNLKTINLELEINNIKTGSKQIGNHAFVNCKNLETVNMSFVEQIDPNAFENCIKITKITAPAIRKIAAEAFSGCTSVIEISINSEVNEIGSRAFKGCAELTRFTFIGNDENKRYKIDEKGALIDNTKKVLLHFPAASSVVNYTIGDNIKVIGDYAFNSNKNLETLIIGNNTEEICENAFDGCTNLRIIAIGSGVKYNGIGKFAFNNCSSLEAINVSGDNAFYFSDKGVLYSYRYKYSEDGVMVPECDIDGKTYPGTIICYPKSLINNSYTIVQNTVGIDTEAFAGNSHIKRIIVPETVEFINDVAFKDCSSLHEIIFKGKLPTILSSSVIFSGIDFDQLTILYSQSKKDYWYPDYKLPYEFRQYSVKEYNAIEQLPELPNDITFSEFYGIIVIDTAGKRINDATVKFGDYAMIQNGGVYLTSLSEETFNNAINSGVGFSVKVTRTGYADYNDVLYLDRDMRISVITLKKEARVWGVSFNGSNLSENGKEDINTKTLSLNKWLYSEASGSQYLGNEVTFVINGDCDNREMIVMFGIVQNGNFIACAEKGAPNGITDISDRTFTVSSSTLEEGGKLEAYMKVYNTDTQDYREVRTPLNIKIYYEALPVHVKYESHSSSPSTTSTTTYSNIKDGVKADYINPNDVVKQLSGKSISFMPKTKFEVLRCLTLKATIGSICPKIKVEKDKTTIEFTVEKKFGGTKDNEPFKVNFGGSIVLSNTDKGVKITQSNVIASFKATYKAPPYEIRPIPAIPILAVKCEVEMSLSGEINISFNIDSNDGKLSIKPGLSLKLGGDISVAASIGLDAGLASAFAGIKGKLSTKATFDLIPFKVSEWYVRGTISLFVKAELNLIIKKYKYERDLELITGTIYLIGGKSITNGQTDSSRYLQNIRQNIYEMSLTKNYAVTSSTDEISIDSNAQLVKLSDNKMILIYITDVLSDDINKNEPYDEYNYQKLVYSVGTKSGGSWIWSDPAIIDDNGFVDNSYSLYYDNEILYIAYNQHNQKFIGNEDAEAVASHAEIKAAKFNGSTFDILGTSITSDNYYDYSAQISVINGTPTVIWQKNTDNNIFGLSNYNYVDPENDIYYAFPTTANEIWCGKYNSSNNSWTISCMADDLPTVNEIAIKDTGDMFLTVDPDSNPFTMKDGVFIDDSVSYVLDINTNYQYSNMPVAQENVFKGMYNTGEDLFYINGTEIKRVSDNSTLTDTNNIDLTTYRVLTDSHGNAIAILFVQCVDTDEYSNGDAVFGVFNNEGEFGDPVMLTAAEPNKYYSTFDAELFGNDIVLMTNILDNTSETTEYYRSISTYDMGKNDLSVENVKLSDIVLKGQSFNTVIDITNNSAKKITNVHIAIKNSAGITVSEKDEEVALLSGENASITVEMPAIYTDISGNYTVIVSANDESALNDNSMTLPFEEVDLEIAGVQLAIDGGNQILVRVTNRGNTNAQNVTLYAYRDDSEDTEDTYGNLENTLLYSLNCGTIEANRTYYYTVNLDKEFLNDTKTGIVTISVQNADENVIEHNEDNNATYISVVCIEKSDEPISESTIQPYLDDDGIQYELVDGTEDVEISYTPNGYVLSKILVGESEYDPIVYNNKLLLSSSLIKSLDVGNHKIEILFTKGEDTCVRQLHIMNFKGYYHATWNVNGETTIQRYAAGTIPEYSGILNKIENDQTVYEFIGWDIDGDNSIDVARNDNLPEIFEDTVYTALYSHAERLYNITFIVDGRATVKSYGFGATPIYNGPLSKTGVNGIQYEFLGWDGNGDGVADYQNNNIESVSADATYIAIFKEIDVTDYVIKFVDYNGSLISEKTYHYGDIVEIPISPSRPSDNTYTYVFDRWTPDITIVTGNTTYTAIYKSTYINYIVKFIDYDDSLISESTYHYGDVVIVPDNPFRESDGQYTYTFAGWDKEITACYGNTIYKATYSVNENLFTVTFKDYNGSVIEVQTYHYGDSVISPSKPTRPSDETYEYEFSGWAPAITQVTGNTIYTATYSRKYIEYTIRFVDYDDSLILEAIYHYGETVQTPDTPIREEDNTYTYLFAGWDKPILAVTENRTYKATYIATYIDYTVRFLNYNGDLISSKTYHYGDTVIVPSNPSKPADNIYTYLFEKWTPVVTIVTGNATYTAMYIATYIEYTIKFVNYDDTIISEAQYHYGDTVTVPNDPERLADNTYTYTFTGWSPAVTGVSGNAVYTATYKATYIEYTVRFVDYDDRVISEAQYHYGDTVTAPANPTREPDGQYTYTFAGWDKEITLCYGNETYRATYTTDENVYTVTFKNYDGAVISVKTYHYGDTVVQPSTPKRASDNEYYYVFTGWTPQVTVVTCDETYTAVYEARLHEWSEPIYDWSADHTTATASRYSVNDNAITQTETVYATIETVEPGCETEGSVTYTAYFTNSAFEAQVYVQTMPAKGHEYEGPVWKWSDDYTSATAMFTCRVCGHTETLNAEVQKTEDDNEIIYTAKVTFEKVEYEDTVTIKVIIYGDVNNDGKIDGRDLIRLRKYLASYDSETGTSDVEIGMGADCNGDGKIDGRDLIRLRKYLASYDDETGTSPVILGPEKPNSVAKPLTDIIIDKRLLLLINT